MTSKIIKGLFATLHLILIKEILNPSSYIIGVVVLYTIVAMIAGVIEVKENRAESMRYINRKI